MPVDKRPDAKNNGAGPPTDPEVMDKALDMEAEANVAAIRAATFEKIKETMSEGRWVNKNEAAARNAEIRRYAEATADQSALDLLRAAPTQGTMAQRPRAPPPPPQNGPPPPWAPRAAHKVQAAQSRLNRLFVPIAPRPTPQTQAAPAPQSAPKLTLKRVLSHEGHPVMTVVPFKMPTVVSTAAAIQQRFLHKMGQFQKPEIQLPDNLDPTTTTTRQYLMMKMSGKPIPEGKKHGTGQRGAHAPVQVPVAPPSGTVSAILTGQIGGSEQEALNKDEAEKEAEGAAEVIEQRPQPPVPVKQCSRTTQMPGSITPQCVKDYMHANYMQPINVVWKGKMVTVPEFMRCSKCEGLMGLWFDTRDPRRKQNQIFPSYICHACHDIRSFAEKFDLDDAVAEAAWPTVKLHCTEDPRRNFDKEMEDAIRRVARRAEQEQQKRRTAPETPCRDRKHHLSENFHCGCSAAGEEAPLIQRGSSVAQEYANPEMPAVEGVTACSLYKLIQKILVKAGKVESEDVKLDEGIMKAITAHDFCETFTEMLAAENGEKQNEVFEEDK